MSEVVLVTNPKGDWRRAYVDGRLVAEGRPGNIRIRPILEACGISVREQIMDFDLLAEAGGEAVG